MEAQSLLGSKPRRYQLDGDHGSYEQLGAVERILNRRFYHYGRFCSRHPILIISLCVLFTGLCGLGAYLRGIDFITDPEDLWVPPSDRTIKEERSFDSSFGRFYRVEQLIITPKNGSNVLTDEILLDLYDLETKMEKYQAKYMNDSTGKYVYGNFSTLCYTPVPNKGCIRQSVLEYFQFNETTLKSYANPIDHIVYCNGTIDNSTCLSSIGAPTIPQTVISGLTVAPGKAPTASAFYVVYLLYDRDETSELALDWERNFIDLAAKANYSSMNVYYDAQRSVEDQLNVEKASDVLTIAISYSVMFLYVAFALGNLPPRRSKILLGLVGVIVVILSIVISVGLCTLFGQKATLIISEVIPFLVLAIGVDNMFIIVNAFEDTDRGLPIDERLGIALSHIGASITMASLSECVAFLLGALTKMPAVKAFCVYAGVAVLADFLLQLTCFCAALVLDARRSLSYRADCIPCVRVHRDMDVMDNGAYDDDHKGMTSAIRWFLREKWSPFLLHRTTKVVVVFIFVALTCSMMYSATHIRLGLDQATSMPDDGYMKTFFAEMNEYLEVGPLFYIVTGAVDYSDSKVQRRIEEMYQDLNSMPYVSRGTVPSWLKNYNIWRSDLHPSYHYSFVEGLYKFVSEDECENYPPDQAQGSQQVPICGFQFRDNIEFNANQTEIRAASFQGMTTALRTQHDFIESMRELYAVTDRYPDLEAYPYSIYFVYFAQYSYMWDVAVQNLLLVVASVFVVTLVLLSDLWTSALIAMLLFMISVDVLGVMALWGIYLNALSVTNLVAGIGLCVEFCVHIARQFLHTRGRADKRAHFALWTMGSNVVSGIFVTKLIGVVVLAFAHTALFRIYYFRMFLAVVFFGMLHGIIFLPVLLSLVGSRSPVIGGSAADK